MQEYGITMEEITSANQTIWLLASCRLNRCDMSIGAGILALLENILSRYQARRFPSLA
jgi:hypothetical protein